MLWALHDYRNYWGSETIAISHMEENKMTREQYFGLKNELKELASKIKDAKPKFRKAQSILSRFQNLNGSYNSYFEGKINSTQWEKIRPEHEKLEKEVSQARSYMGLAYDYRHKHIIYSFARGKTMSQIENKVREGNEPSIHELERLMKVYGVEKLMAVSA
jgi:hypothetical protein